MKKLLFFASDFKIGLSSLLTDQLISIKNLGVEVLAVAGENEQEPDLAKMLEYNNVDITRIDGLDSHTEIMRLVKSIKDIVVKNDIDIIHVQNNWQLAIAGIVKNKLWLKRKVSIIYTLHGFRHNSPIKSRIAQAIIGSTLFLLADHVICMTEFLCRKFRLLSHKIALIPLGIKDDYFNSEFVIPHIEGLHLVFPAQFRKGKNQDMIIRTFAQYIKESNDTTSILNLPGNGPLLQEMKQLASNLGIADRVIFPGFISKGEVKRLNLKSNIAIVASNSETFGQSIVEPYVLGRCVISTPVGIAPEIIKDGENGFIFKNEKELKDTLLKINSDKNILIKIGNNNYQCRDKFSWNNVTKKYIETLLDDQ